MCVILYTRMLVCRCECVSLSTCVRVCVCVGGGFPLCMHTHTRVLYTCKCAANVHNAMCYCSYVSEYAKAYMQVSIFVCSGERDRWLLYAFLSTSFLFCHVWQLQQLSTIRFDFIFHVCSCNTQAHI